MNKKIGFVGVGMMGANLARHLNDKGWDIMNINTAGLAEGLGIGDALGHDVDMLRDVFSQTGANSRVLETDAEDMRDRDHECWFSAEHAGKDSGIAADMAKSVGEGTFCVCTLFNGGSMD